MERAPPFGFAIASTSPAGKKSQRCPRPPAPPNLLRLSAGAEDAGHLIADFERAQGRGLMRQSSRPDPADLKTRPTPCCCPTQPVSRSKRDQPEPEGGLDECACPNRHHLPRRGHRTHRRGCERLGSVCVRFLVR